MVNPTKSATTPQQEVTAAMQFWRTIEYLSPQKPPKLEMTNDSCVWELEPNALTDRHMPWNDEDKKSEIELISKPKQSHSFMLYGGVVTGIELVETVRDLVGALSIDLTEQKAPEGGASFVIPVDRQGCVAGEVFISSVPWAIGCIERAHEMDHYFNFSGFFGDDGVQEEFKAKVSSLLKKRNLIKATEDEFSVGGKKVKAASSQRGGASPEAFDALEGAQPETNPLRSLNPDDVRAIADLVFGISQWKPKHPGAWIIKAQRCSENGPKKSGDDPLNSFFAEDIEKVHKAYLEGKAGNALKQFLETPESPFRCDLEKTREHLIAGTHPSLTPLACWPSEFPLATSQQFAVNAITRDLKNEGLFSVNGPPGTGKTTMLKDILAGIVTQRADQLVTFNDPLDAFSRKLEIEGVNFPTWGIDDKLRGFGVVVACVNNGAAENISRDLPGLGSIDQTVGMNYFATVADSYALPDGATVRSEKCWGMVSAALGNSENRSVFARDFWFGRSKPAAKINTSPEEPPAELDPLRLHTLQDWHKDFAHMAPSWKDAKISYEKARLTALGALEQAATLATHLQNFQTMKSHIEHAHAQLDAFAMQLTDLQARKAKADAQVGEELSALCNSKAVVVLLTARDAERAKVDAAQKVLSLLLQSEPAKKAVTLTTDLDRAKKVRVRVLEDSRLHQASKPRWFSLDWSGKTAWTARNGKLQSELDISRQTLTDLECAQGLVQIWNNNLTAAQAGLHAHEATLSQALDAVLAVNGNAQMSLGDAQADVAKCATAHKRFVAAQANLSKMASDCQACIEGSRLKLKDRQSTYNNTEALLQAAGLLGETRNAWHLNNVSRDDFHRASPYHDDQALFLARRALFVAALDLHKAFIVHAWSKLKNNLARCMYMLQGTITPGKIKGGPMELWDSLFLVVPLVSSTFASFPRLFRGVGQEQLAWVLIDEAGQAAPQNCVGALWRAKRAVVVGDPRQLEPVVGLPEELVNPLRKYFGTQDRYVPPMASTQTMADISNRYGMYFGATVEDRGTWLGSPLLVHRRCIDPMFRIANAIAYEDKMVYGGGADKLGTSIPYSRWVNVPANGGDGHWIPSQADRVIKMINKLLDKQLYTSEGKLRLYVISPFKKVAENMRQELISVGCKPKEAKEMCGTVHTFQGREADYVIFLLGGDPGRPGVISGFAGKNPNLVNVALTRAKKRFYVVGDKTFWTGSGDSNQYYSRMATALDSHGATEQRLLDTALVDADGTIDSSQPAESLS